MEESTENSQRVEEPSSSSLINFPSTSRTEEEGNNGGSSSSRNEAFPQPEQLQNHQEQRQRGYGVSYRFNFSISNVSPSEIRDDVWSCVFVLVTFWLLASMTLILGFYGSVTIQLGPNYSRLIQTNRFFVQSIKVENLGEHNSGLELYGFHKQPPLDINISWTEFHDTTVPVDFHKEWLFFFNKGSEVSISYSVKSTSYSPLSLVIVQGRESLLEWIEDPSYPNSTLSWQIIYGHGKIQQIIPTSSDYYIAVGNFNPEEVEIELKFSVKAFIYDTTGAYYRCTFSNHLCNLYLHLLTTNAAVLSSSGPTEGSSSSSMFVKVSYGTRWITYLVGSATMTIFIFFALKFCKKFQTAPIIDRPGYHPAEMGSARTPLLHPKDDDTSSWGSSYDSASHDEEDLQDWLAAASIQELKDRESSNPPRCCVVCFDAPRECFFLPCGHCATCFACGTRISEDAGSCPICRRKMKKVRRIFTV